MPLRLKSASRPWPTASCSRMPLSPGARTTSICPAGASSRVEHRDRLPRRLARVPLRALALEVARCSCARRRRSSPPAACRPSRRWRARRSARAAACRATIVPSLVDDEDLADLLGEARLDLHDARVVRVRRRRRALEQRALVEAGHVERDPARARSGSGSSTALRARSGAVAASAARDLRRGLRRALHRVPVELLDVGVAGRVALLDAHPEPHRDAARGALEDALVEDEAAGRAVLEEEVGVVAARAPSATARSLLGEGGVDRATARRARTGRGRGPSGCWSGHLRRSERTCASRRERPRGETRRRGSPLGVRRAYDAASVERHGARARRQLRAEPRTARRARSRLERATQRRPEPRVPREVCSCDEIEAILVASLLVPAPSRAFFAIFALRPRFTPRHRPGVPLRM